jgi:pimeloyl-ACP methyl ester carboxylesterase
MVKLGERNAMTTYVLVPGGGGQAWYWHRVVPLLRAASHTAIAVGLPAADEAAGLADYTDAIVRSARTAPGCVVVAQSMGGFSAPQACEPLDASRLVLVNAMIPMPGEVLGEWWDHVGQPAARAAKAVADGRDSDAEFDPFEVFFHDVPADVVEAAKSVPPPEQAARPFADAWPLGGWPDVPTVVLSSADDRFLPLELQQRVAQERLGITTQLLPGGHLPALACPEALVGRLL